VTSLYIPAPAAPEAERYLLSMCFDGQWRAVDYIAAHVSPDHFHSALHRLVYDKILNLWSAKATITWQAVVLGLGPTPIEELDSEGNERDSKKFVYDIHASVPFDESVAGFLCGELIEKFEQRRLQRMMEKAIEQITSGSATASSLRHSLAEQLIISGSSATHLGRTVAEVLEGGYRDELLDRLDNPERIVGIRTGQWIIDKVLGGLENSRVYTGLAGTGLGKSFWVHWLALQIAEESEEQRPIVFSTEMPDFEVVHRMAYMKARLDSLHFRRGNRPTFDQRKAVERAMDAIQKLPIVLVSAGSMDVQAMQMEVRRQKSKMGANVVFIDHIQGLRAKGLDMSKERELINEVTSFTKAMAMDLEIPVMQISHIHRQAKGEITRPEMADAHGSGSIERDSDSVFSLHPVVRSEFGAVTNFASREAYNKHKDEKGGVHMEVMWHKSRSGGSPYAIYFMSSKTGGNWEKVTARG